MGKEEIPLAGEHGAYQSMEVCYILLVYLLGTSLRGCLT